MQKFTFLIATYLFIVKSIETQFVIYYNIFICIEIKYHFNHGKKTIKMSDQTNIIPPEEIDLHVQSLRKSNLQDIGNEQWMNQHEILLKLNQQATYEAKSYQEEIVKELLITENKLPIILHEIYVAFIWRTKILPRLIKINSNPKASFMIYTVFYHEASAVCLLENVLFHQNGCESLQDTTLDLIDYCVQSITQLIGLVNIGHKTEPPSAELLNESGADELERLKRTILYKIGMRCLTILSYVADKCELLPLSACRRLVQTHDTLCLLSEILHCKPWLCRSEKGIEKFIDDKWNSVTGDDLIRVCKIEAQTWFCFRQLLFNGNVMKMYEINSFRQRELAKCQGLMNDTLLDQLPPLIELKQYLCTLTISGNPTINPATVILEEMPKIKDEIIDAAKRNGGGYKNITEQQANIFLEQESEKICLYAKRLQAAYNIDLLSKYEEEEVDKVQITENEHFCGNCAKISTKKCSNCEVVYYCSRECQVNDWPLHQTKCRKIL